jgi:ribosomal-protein-alanine N-acetyltransferase
MSLYGTSPRIHVEDAEMSDMDCLAEIHEASFANPWSADDIAAMTKQPGVVCLVSREMAPRGRHVRGFALLRRAADEAEVLTIAVEPEKRKKGFGRKLLEEAMRRLFREHAKAVFLEVDETNAGAIALYRSLGFSTIATREGYYRDRPGAVPRTALVMRAQLR